jgi:hypothetical protein
LEQRASAPVLEAAEKKDGRAIGRELADGEALHKAGYFQRIQGNPRQGSRDTLISAFP